MWLPMFRLLDIFACVRMAGGSLQIPVAFVLARACASASVSIPAEIL